MSFAARAETVIRLLEWTVINRCRRMRKKPEGLPRQAGTFPEEAAKHSAPYSYQLQVKPETMG